MLSIKPSSVPEYLKGSAFFSNLSEDDEEMCVPEDCCKFETSVTNAADLDELLRTLRFWGVDHIPVTVVHFIILNDIAVWEQVTVNYVTDLPPVADLVQIVGCEREKQVCKAATLRNVDIVACLLEHGCPSEYSTCYESIRAVNIAARNGDLDILKVLRLHNCQVNEDTCGYAALGGNCACLKYLLENGCPVAKDLFNRAMRSGKVEMIQYLHDRGLPWSENILRLTHSDISDMGTRKETMVEVMKEVKVCLLYAYKLGYPWDPCTCSTACIYGWYDVLVDAHERGSMLHRYCTMYAAANGHLDCLIYLHENGCPWDEVLTAYTALEKKHIDCFMYAAEHGCPIPRDTFCAAIFCGSVEVIQYLHDRGVAWPDNILSAINTRSHEDAAQGALGLAHAYKLGCPRIADTCYYASKHGWYDVLVEAHKHGCMWDESCASSAAAHGQLDCLIYLHDHGCPWNENVTFHTLGYMSEENHDWLSDRSFSIAGNKYFDCLKYAVERGCPLPSAGKFYDRREEVGQFLRDRGVDLHWSRPVSFCVSRFMGF